VSSADGAPQGPKPSPGSESDPETGPSSGSVAASAAPPSAAPTGAKPGALYRLGHWCATRWLWVLISWVIALIALQFLSSSFGGEYSDNFSLPGTQSQTGLDVLRADAPQSGGYSAQVVLHDSKKPLTDDSSQINQVTSSLAKLPHVLSAANPLPQNGQPATALSKDEKIGYITMRFDVTPGSLGTSYVDQVDTAVQPLRAANVQVEYGGSLGELARPKAADRTSEAIGFGVAIVVLLIGFGSVFAAVMPLLTALMAVIVGLAILSLVANLTTFATVSPTLATMIGIGVGIDYALFLITRHRQQLMDGLPAPNAAGRAVATSGRAVIVSGTTVIIALAGLYVSRIGFIGKLGVAAAITVITAVLGAVTLVPALLGLFGRSIDRFKVRKLVAEGTTGGAEATGMWHDYARKVERRPWYFLVAGLIILGILTIPLFSIRLGHVGDGADPESFTDRRAFDLVSEGFGPGANGPLTIVIDQSQVPASQQSQLASNLKSALTNVPGAASISPLQASDNGKALFGTAVSTVSPQDAGTNDLFNHLQDDVLPGAIKGTAAKAYITGTTAAQIDFLELISQRLPLIILVVVGLAFLIILIVFRGLLVAVKAAVLNLLSIGASYGVLVAVFQWGWGGPQLGVNGKVPIESYVPMMMFAIIFGLSMDYEVFLLSRVHEAWMRTKDAPGSVAHGLEITARVITCAALIMVSVFAAFILSDNVVVKMLGLGLAVSVLVDATIVRLLLVPAVMTLLGAHAWWLPRWLDKILPHIDIEGEGELAREGAAVPARA